MPSAATIARPRARAPSPVGELPRWARAALAVVVPPFAALAVIAALWPVVRPFAWFAFFPAVFAGAWVGGRLAGVATAALSTGLVVAAFIPPGFPVVGLLVPAGVLVATGVAVGALRERLGVALDDARSAGAQLASLVQLAPDGIFVADLDGRYTDVNDAGCRLLGYAREELIGKTILDLLPPEEHERLRGSRDELLRGRVELGEWSLRRRDGAYVPVEVSARILPGGRWQGLVRDVGERRRVEQALRRSEEDLRRAQAVAHVGSWWLDVRRNELRWSEEAYRIFGVAPGTPLTYETFLACVHPEDRAFVDRRWKAALGGEPYDVEHRVVADGAVKWVRERADLERDERGELVGGIGTTQDITEHKRVEAELRAAHETERRLRAGLEAVSRAETAVADAVTALTGPDRATVLNMIALQARALTGAELVAVGVGADPDVPFAPWISLGMPPGTEALVGRPPRPIGTLGLVSRAGQTIRADDIRAHPGFRGFPPGHPELASLLGVPIHYRGRPVGNVYLANPPGGPTFSAEDERRVRLLAARVGVAIETATLYAGEAGKRTWLQSVLEQMPDAVVVMGRDERPLMHNQAAALLLHGPDPLAHELRDPAGARTEDAGRPLLRALREGATVVRAEHLLGVERIPVLISATPVRAGDEVIGAVAVFQDIREQKEAERLREEWTSIVAHDLRQPVSTIRLAADRLRALRARPPADPERALIERVRDSAERLGRMINDLLDASCVEADRLALEPRRVDVAALARRCAEQVDARATRVRVVAPEEAWARADAHRVEQVLDNLLSNAAKYGTPGAEVALDVSLAEREVVVAVTNAGPGIPPHELSALFSRFARSREARASATPGLGLGLYIARGIVRAHGGDLVCESGAGRTSFRFTLPRA